MLRAMYPSGSLGRNEAVHYLCREGSGSRVGMNYREMGWRAGWERVDK